MAPRDLVAALGREDLAALVAIPGVGMKTAQRILVDLRDRVASLVDACEPAPAPADRAAPDRLEAVVSALVNLGTPRPRAERVGREALEAASEGVGLEALVREALRRLAR